MMPSPDDEEINNMNIKNVDEAKKDNNLHDDQGDILEENILHEDKKENRKN